MRKYRFPGVKPFETADQQIFFGRDKNIEELYHLILLEKLVVLFGKSGYGKTSLLNAGIIPRFLKAPESISYLPISIRFGLYIEGRSFSPLEQVRNRLSDVSSLNPNSQFLAKGKSLWHQFKSHQQVGQDQHFLLIFDQFEEFFSYPEDQQKQFKDELAELLYKNLPQPVKDSWEEYTNQQQDYLLRKLDVKALFAIRSDRMSELDSLKGRLPAILYKRYELHGLGDEQAKQAIVYPASLPKDEGNDFLAPAFSYTPEALNKIVTELSGKAPTSTSGYTRKGIEAFILQLLCLNIEKQVIAGKITQKDEQGLPMVAVADLPDIDQVYEAYYRSQLQELSPEEQEAARELIEFGLLFQDEETGEARRVSLDADLLVQRFAAHGATHELLKKLEDTFLLRREANTLGGYNYELSHDTLLTPVVRARAEREILKERQRAEQRTLEAEARVLVVEERARELLALQEQTKRNEIRAKEKARLARSIASIVVLFAAVAVIVGLYAFSSRAKAEEATRLAEQEKMTADSLRRVAEMQTERLQEMIIQIEGLKNQLDETKGSFYVKLLELENLITEYGGFINLVFQPEAKDKLYELLIDVFSELRIISDVEQCYVDDQKTRIDYEAVQKIYSNYLMRYGLSRTGDSGLYINQAIVSHFLQTYLKG
jgi:hypothetical protein